MTVDVAMHAQLYSWEQIHILKDFILTKVSFTELMKRTDVVIDEKNSGRWTRVKCPFHKTNTFDAGRVREADEESKQGTFFCNNNECKVHDDPFEGRLNMFQFWQLIRGFSNEKEAVLDLYANILEQPLPEPTDNPMSEEQRREFEKAKRRLLLYLHTTVFYYNKLFKTEEGKKGLEYIEKVRKIPKEYAKKYYLGYASGGQELINYLMKQGFTVDEIREARLLSRKGNDLMYDRIIVPIFERDNVRSSFFKLKNSKVVDFYGRACDPESDLKHLYINRDRPLFNFAEARRKKEGLMVEGIFDTLAGQVYIDALTQMENLGRIPEDISVNPSDLGVFTSYGTNGLSEKHHIPQLERANFDVLYIAGDHDKNFAGQTSNIERGEILQKALPNTKIRIVMWDDKDLNDMLKAGIKPLEFMNYLKNAVSLEEYKILVALEKCGNKEEVRNQFEALNSIEELLIDLDFEQENGLLKYKRTLQYVADYANIDVEDIMLHVLSIKYKQQLKQVSKDNNIPLKHVLMSELSTINKVFN